MKDKEEEEEMMSEMEVLRETLASWEYFPYHYQPFNKEECPVSEWRNPVNSDALVARVLAWFDLQCDHYRSFKFSVEPARIGEVKHCSYSDLQKITDFKPGSLIQKTLSGRLFHGTIGEGSKKRPAIVKTWDFFLPEGPLIAQRRYKFCDEIELFIDEEVKMHPKFVKLHSFCCETRLAAIYDEKFTGLLSDVLLDDEFGWDKRIYVATQLANLLVWLQKKRISVGCVTASCIMINEEADIKVFDFGFVSHCVDQDTKISLAVPVGREDPAVILGERTMKSDVYIFGLLLLELISKENFDDKIEPSTDWSSMRLSLEEEARSNKKGLVHDLMEVDEQTALKITSLTLRCMNLLPEKRPTMKTVSDNLRALFRETGHRETKGETKDETKDLSAESRVEKRKRDGDDAQVGLAEDWSAGEMRHGG